MIVILRQLSEKRMLHNFTQKRTMIRILFQALSNKVIERLRPIRLTVESRRWISQDLKHRTRRMHISKRRLTVGQLNRCNAQRPHFSARLIANTTMLIRTCDHLRCHPRGRSDERKSFSLGRLDIPRQAKIAEFDLTIFGHQNITATNIAMHALVFVQMQHSFGRFA